MKKVIIISGWMSCILNRLLNQKVRNYLIANGYKIVNNAEEADYFVFAGCAVTESTELYNIIELRLIENIIERSSETKKIILIGCLHQINNTTEGHFCNYQQVSTKLKLNIKYTDNVESQFVTVGQYNMELLDKIFTAKIPYNEMPNPSEIESRSGIGDMQMANNSINFLPEEIKRAFKISFMKQTSLQYKLVKQKYFYPVYADYLQAFGYKNISIGIGCKNKCAYCAIKFAKNKIRSEKIADIISQVKDLSNKGENSFFFLCDDLRSWGLDIKSDWTILLHELSKISTEKTKYAFFNVKVEDILEQKELFDKMVEKGIISYIGLMGQHVNERILTLMKRERFCKNEFLNIINEYGDKGVHMHSYNIVGFPQETEDEFLELVEFVDKIETPNFSLLNFPYSDRKGTLAADYPNKVDRETKRKRLEVISKHYIENSNKRFRKLDIKTATMLNQIVQQTVNIEMIFFDLTCHIMDNFKAIETNYIDN